MDPLDTTKMKTHPRVFVVDGSTWLVLFLDHCPYRLALPLHLLLLLLLLLAFIALVAAAALFVLVSVMLVSATDTRKDCGSIVTSATKHEKKAQRFGRQVMIHVLFVAAAAQGFSRQMSCLLIK